MLKRLNLEAARIFDGRSVRPQVLLPLFSNQGWRCRPISFEVTIADWSVKNVTRTTSWPKDKMAVDENGDKCQINKAFTPQEFSTFDSRL